MTCKFHQQIWLNALKLARQEPTATVKYPVGWQQCEFYSEFGTHLHLKDSSPGRVKLYQSLNFFFRTAASTNLAFGDVNGGVRVSAVQHNAAQEQDKIK